MTSQKITIKKVTKKEKERDRTIVMLGFIIKINFNLWIRWLMIISLFLTKFISKMKNRESVMKISKRLKREKRLIFRNQKRKLFKNYIRNRFIEIRFRSEHMLS